MSEIAVISDVICTLKYGRFAVSDLVMICGRGVKTGSFCFVK